MGEVFIFFPHPFYFLFYFFKQINWVDVKCNLTWNFGSHSGNDKVVYDMQLKFDSGGQIQFY